MLFTFFTIMVFIAELIIANTIITKLLAFDRKILEGCDFLTGVRPKINSCMLLMRGISEQLAELVPLWIEDLREIRNRIILKKTESLIASILFLSINVKVINKLRKSRLFKAFCKGLSLIQSMV